MMLTPQYLRELQAAILADQECQPLAVTPEMGKVEGGAHERDREIARLMATRRSRYVPRRLSSLGLAARFPASGQLPGPLHCELVLQKMEAFAAAAAASQQQPTALFGAQIKRQMLHLAGDGIDFGDPALHAMFESMVGAGAITEEEAAALKSVARESESITADQVSRALRGPWGDEQE